MQVECQKKTQKSDSSLLASFIAWSKSFRSRLRREEKETEAAIKLDRPSEYIHRPIINRFSTTKCK
jgi:hypothetical protein